MMKSILKTKDGTVATKNLGEAKVIRKRWFERLALWLKSRGRHRMIYREKDGVFEVDNYLERFYIVSTPWFGVYLHRFWADDDDGLHDHPWNSLSILLAGAYNEEMPERQAVPYGPTIMKLRRPLHPLVYMRSKYAAHRITVPFGHENTWSLFIRFGLQRRQWGFYRHRGWEASVVQSRKEELSV